MNARPETPPQHIKAGDPWCDDVAVILDGFDVSAQMWFEVDAINGVGWRYKPEDNERAELTTELMEERGKFEIRWRDDEPR